MNYYRQVSGCFSQEGKGIIGNGYAGNGPGLNNPSMQNVPEVGPLPAGKYTIGPAYHHEHLGPLTMDLTPDPANEMFRRDLFRIHGRKTAGDKTSSKGCIVLDREVREAISECADRELTVEP